MAAVAVYAIKPTPEALLARRLEHGWKPTPSPMVEGDIVLGYAACSATARDKLAEHETTDYTG